MADVSRGDWQCPNPECHNNSNFPMSYVYGSSPTCKKCGSPKPASGVASKSAASMGMGTTMGSTMGMGMGMGMGMMGMGMPMMTMGGMQGVPAAMNPGGVSPPREGDWHCANPSCKNHRDNVVYSGKVQCPLCGMAKPAQPVMAKPAGAAGSQHQNQQQQQLLMALAAYGGGQMSTGGVPQFTAGGQVCTVATPMPTGKFARPGDWNCVNPQCKNHIKNVVYGSKETCPLCGTPKPPTGARVVGMRPGDWHCPSPYCKNHTDNVVYGSKDRCPLCNTARPDGRDRSRSPR